MISTTSPARTRWWPRQRKEPAVSGDVVALHFDEDAVAEELADWCGGQVVLAEGVDGGVTVTVYVPTRKGPKPAVLGDWIVRRPDGTFEPCDAVAFRAKYEPQDGAL